MDFSTHGRQPAPGPNTNRFTSADERPTVSEPNKPRRQSGGSRNPWIRAVLIIFLLCLVALVVALILVIGISKEASETRYVNTNDYQVVEVANPNASGPSYYYGKITDAGFNYLVLSNASVLTSKLGDQNITVAPLACVSPNATSQIVFNRGQVILWDNLDPSSSAAQAVSQLASSNGVCSTTTPQASTPNGSQTTNPSGSTGSQSAQTGTTQPTGTNSSTSSNTSTGSTSPTPKVP